mgnify:CR=1 FL=1
MADASAQECLPPPCLMYLLTVQPAKASTCALFSALKQDVWLQTCPLTELKVPANAVLSSAKGTV